MQFQIVNNEIAINDSLIAAIRHVFDDIGLFYSVEEKPAPETSPFQIPCFLNENPDREGLKISCNFQLQLDRIRDSLLNQSRQPLLFESEIEDGSLYLKTDLFAWVFFLISCSEDDLFPLDSRDLHGRIPFRNSLADIQDWQHHPRISEVIERFQEILRNYTHSRKIPLFVKDPWPGGYKKAVLITHDIDIVDKWWLYAGKLLQENLLKRDFGAAVTVAGKTAVNLATLHNPAADVKWIVELEKSFGFRSSWHFLSGIPTVRSFLQADVTYGLTSIEKIIRHLPLHDVEIGLHSSYQTVDDIYSLAKQRSDLEQMLGNTVRGLRAHFLRHDGLKFFKNAANSGFLWDSSLGFSECSAFKCGFTSPFRPVSGNSFLDLWEFPLNWMDRSFSKYQTIDVNTVLENFKSLAGLFDVYGGVLTLLWHNYSRTDFGFTHYERLYEDILKYLAEKAFYNDTPERVVEWLNDRLNTGMFFDHDKVVFRAVDRSKALDCKNLPPGDLSTVQLDCKTMNCQAVFLSGKTEKLPFR